MNQPILVIDDDQAIRLLYKEQLGRSGYEVQTAASGEEALSKTSTNSFGLVVLDIEMPDMSGLELLHLLRESSPQTPIILNTAYSLYKLDFQSWLADAYIVKSSDLAPLLNKIRELTPSK